MDNRHHFEEKISSNYGEPVMSKKYLAAKLKSWLDKTTLEQAKEYEADSEKFIFCVEFLQISANDDHCDDWVEVLETHFEAMLAEDKKGN